MLGGIDGAVTPIDWAPPATNRLLAGYVPAGEVFRCPADRGHTNPFFPDVHSLFDELGCSYHFNDSARLPY
jgi:hypothetical protein